jgi:undecaprenyl phosphate-alpha-L-ara4FN deformylase
MRYHSDCRGTGIFRPVVDGAVTTPQIPATLPTYDELIGSNGITDENFNGVILDQLRPRQLNVLTIHAEVEGIAKRTLFEAFLTEAVQRNIRFVPLGDLLPQIDQIPAGRIEQGSVHGRDGNFCVQAY